MFCFHLFDVWPSESLLAGSLLCSYGREVPHLHTGVHVVGCEAAALGCSFFAGFSMMSESNGRCCCTAPGPCDNFQFGGRSRRA